MARGFLAGRLVSAYLGAMSKVINLRTRRKQAARDASRRAATENATLHAEGKAARALRQARAEKAQRELDAHAREGQSPAAGHPTSPPDSPTS